MLLEPPQEDALGTLALEAPPMKGLEYLDAGTLRAAWSDIDDRVRSEVAASGQSPRTWLHEKNPLWRLVGRVTLHLAENKRDKELLASSGGLVRLRGQWVEVDGEKLAAALAHWKKVEKDARAGGLSFYEGMRLLAGAADGGRALAEPPQPLQEWSGTAPSPRRRSCRLKRLAGRARPGDPALESLLVQKGRDWKSPPNQRAPAVRDAADAHPLALGVGS